MGYDDKGVWVSDGCAASSWSARQQERRRSPRRRRKLRPTSPTSGFLIFEGEKGEIYMRLFSYVRYLNQKGLDSDLHRLLRQHHLRAAAPGHPAQQVLPGLLRLVPDAEVPLLPLCLDANTSQGDPAQVVGAGNLSYTFNRYVTLGGGINSLPSVRSTEGQFPYWLGVDNRLTADEFFRGSYTSGFWLKGELSTKVKYMAMIGNNLSQLGVSAAQLDNTLNTTSFMLGVAAHDRRVRPLRHLRRLRLPREGGHAAGGHYTHSREDKQNQPGTNSIENSQIRLTDGSIIFTPDLFGPGITVEKVNYDMVSVDAGVKNKGLSLEVEYYWRWLSQLRGHQRRRNRRHRRPRVPAQSSAMLVHKTLQAYLSGSDPGPLRQRLRGAGGRQLVRGQGTWPPAQRGVDPPEQLSRGLHGRPLSRGRQRQRLPLGLRDELLMRHMP